MINKPLIFCVLIIFLFSCNKEELAWNLPRTNPFDYSPNNLPNFACNMSTQSTIGDVIQITNKPYFLVGDSINITLSSGSQVNYVELYNCDTVVGSFGNWQVFSWADPGYSRIYTIPSVPASNCYNIRIGYGASLFVSPTFTIIP